MSVQERSDLGQRVSQHMPDVASQPTCRGVGLHVLLAAAAAATSAMVSTPGVSGYTAGEQEPAEASDYCVWGADALLSPSLAEGQLAGLGSCGR